MSTEVAINEWAEVDLDGIESVSSSLDLRRPNREALESIAWMSWHHFASSHHAPFEGVIESATGVGKTYIIAGALDYFAAEGIRNFAVICPGRTILNKTVDNFTAGSARSLLAGMEAQPVVITADNFDTAAMRARMDDTDEVKLYIFTVQSLVRPTTKVGKRTHKFQEGLGTAFYARLQEADDLTVFADEAHMYWGRAFADAVRQLRPLMQIGLTATPDDRTPPEQIIYRYPLAQAIADKLVKTPVLVGRKDDRCDPETKLLDGIALLERKEQAIARYCEKTGATPIEPLMLVVAQSIDEAKELGSIISGESFAGGRYADRVLTVHSEAADEALEALESVGAPGSQYRVVISVGMLKEGWDNKSVYVLASMRASVSTILTEQTLGRGMRLPFGAYTGIQLLDTLEVLGHERYEQLLKKAGVLNREFVSYRTRLTFQQDAEGRLVPVIETEEISPEISTGGDGATGVDGSGVDGSGAAGAVGATGAGAGATGGGPGGATAGGGTGGTAVARADGDAVQPSSGAVPGSGGPGVAAGIASSTGPVIASMEDYAQAADDELIQLQQELHPNHEVRVPRLKMTPVSVKFSLADITDKTPFTQLGQRIAGDPVGELRRVTLSARTVQGPDGIWRTHMVTAPAVDVIESTGVLIPLEAARSRLAKQVLAAPAVPARPQEAQALGQLLEAFITGLGDKAEEVLSAYMDRAAAGFIDLINKEQRRFGAKPQFDEVIETYTLAAVRFSKETETDRMGKFKRGAGYEYKKSLYAQDWFDSAPERDVANILDNGNDITWWLRLQVGDLPILWAQGREYNPDFIACDKAGTRWVVEVKSDKDLPSDEVQAKREAAQRWANHVSADPGVSEVWRYLLVGEHHVATAKGSWGALKSLGE